MRAAPIVVCEISARDSVQTRALAEIARTCAADLGQPVTLRTIGPAAAAAVPLVTLHLPAALAATQHQVWCLACRLACFCPSARVSVLVRATAAFAGPRRRHRRAA